MSHENHNDDDNDNDDNELTPEDELRAENEINKLNLELKGGTFFSSGNIPPDIEKMFLDHIMQFEEAHRNAKIIKVYEFLGAPTWTAEGELDDAQIHTELSRILEIMTENGIGLDVNGEYEERVIYKFITEELFELERQDIRLPGMMNQYVFEDFHPNDTLDTNSTTEEFIELLLSSDDDVEEDDDDDDEFNFLRNDDDEEEIDESARYRRELNEVCIDKHGKELPRDKVVEKLIAFRTAFGTIKNLVFEVEKTEVIENQATVTFQLSYSAQIAGSLQELSFDGEGTCKLIREAKGDYWMIQGIKFPGFEV
jgi:hypothetical protein